MGHFVLIMREVTKKFIPRHLGIIMDGNRRWAHARGLPALQGHAQGYQKVKQVCQWCLDRGIKYLTVWAFSTENWKRSKREVSYLMRMMEMALTRDIREFHQKGVKLQVIGSRKGLSRSLIKAINQAEDLTRSNIKGVFNVAFNYGGQSEIIDGVKQMLKDRVDPKKVDNKLFFSYLYTQGLPDLDFIIRTSGELRLSGFLLWLSTYAELYFSKLYWPAFSEKELDNALAEFAQRERRFGGSSYV